MITCVRIWCDLFHFNAEKNHLFPHFFVINLKVFLLFLYSWNAKAWDENCHYRAEMNIADFCVNAFFPVPLFFRSFAIARRLASSSTIEATEKRLKFAVCIRNVEGKLLFKHYPFNFLSCYQLRVYSNFINLFGWFHLSA